MQCYVRLPHRRVNEEPYLIGLNGRLQSARLVEFGGHVFTDCGQAASHDTHSTSLHSLRIHARSHLMRIRRAVQVCGVNSVDIVHCRQAVQVVARKRERFAPLRRGGSFSLDACNPMARRLSNSDL